MNNINITSEKREIGLVEDGIKTIFDLSQEDFDKVIEKMKPKRGTSPKTLGNLIFHYLGDKCEYPERQKIGLENEENKIEYINNTCFPQKFFFEKLNEYLNKYPEDSIEYIRVSSLMKTRNLEAAKEIFYNSDEENTEKNKLVDKTFEMLTNQEMYEQFLDYENNKTNFSIVEGKATNIEEYFKILGEVFGYDNGRYFSNLVDWESGFYIPQLEEIKRRVKGIYGKFNVDRYVDPRYTFKEAEGMAWVIDNPKEYNFEINPELFALIKDYLPKELSIEEQVLAIDTMLCDLLEYDEEYAYRNKDISNMFLYDFSKSHMESLTIGSKATCFDIARMSTKLINMLKGDVKAFIIAYGANWGHFATGFYTDKVSAILEPVNLSKDTTNDITKSKIGAGLKGIKIISDREGIIPRGLERVHNVLYKEDSKTIEDFFSEYIAELNELPQMDIPNNLELKIEAFTESMKEKGVKGNEFTQILNGMFDKGFFGENAKKVFIGRREIYKDETHRQRMILFTEERKKLKGETGPYYLIDTNSLEVTTPNKEELREKFYYEDYIYEDDNYTLEDIR